MSRFKLCFLTILAACLSVSAQNVYFTGEPEKSLKKALVRDGYKVVKALDNAHLAIVDGRAPVSPALRSEINSFLESGAGSVIFLGQRAFDYSPAPFDEMLVADFSKKSGWEFIEDRREKKPRFTESPALSLTNDHKGRPAVELKTKKDCSKDCFIQINADTPLPDGHDVLLFSAKGNEWMDVLSAEITDASGNVWISFVPLSCEWADYALPLADFLPLGRQKGDPAQSLKASEIKQLRLGTNISVIWYEQPTLLALGQVRLARNAAPYSAPESSLQRVKVPFEKCGTAIPEDIYDPVWRAANPWDVSQNEADTKIGNYSKKDRESRIVKTGCGTLEFFPEGKRQGGAVALFPEWEPKMASDILEAASKMTRTPMCVSTRMNMKDGRAQLTVWMRNPLDTPLKGKLKVNLSDLLQKESSCSLQERGITAKVCILPEIPEGFPTSRFDWSVTLDTAGSEDVLGGTIDLERALILACKHLVLNQKNLPDGRISNHYFGDAYGVRAMLILVWNARRDPAFIERHADLLNGGALLDEIENAAYRWLDMMCDRQHPDGLMYMGYSEPRSSSNVADMGEITTCVFQVLKYVGDPVRRNRYEECFEKTVKWMENFYIADEEDSEEVRRNWSKYVTKKHEDQIGRYGLGMMGSKRRTYGPIWVNELIMPAHCILAFYGNPEQKAFFRPIFDRNSDYMMTQSYSSNHYYHAESTFWHWYVTPSESRKALLEENMTRTMLGERFKGNPMEPYDRGGRSAMNAMPLLYYQRHISDSPEIRAVLLKYLWSFAEMGSYHAIERLSEAFPKAIHGEGIAASKFAGHSAIWAVEALWPDSTLL